MTPTFSHFLPLKSHPWSKYHFLTVFCIAGELRADTRPLLSNNTPRWKTSQLSYKYVLFFVGRLEYEKYTTHIKGFFRRTRHNNTRILQTVAIQNLPNLNGMNALYILEMFVLFFTLFLVSSSICFSPLESHPSRLQIIFRTESQRKVLRLKIWF